MISATAEPQEIRTVHSEIIRRALPSLLVVQAVLGLLYLFLVPLWMPSDERAHMRYIMDLAATGHLHVMQIGDASYETHQPPLFYVLAVLPYLLVKSLPLSTAGYVLRAFCFVFQMLSTVLVADIFRRHLSSRPILALASLVFFALNPSLLAINATISNDALSFFLTILAAWILSRNDFQIVSARQSIALGIAVALGLACKLTVFPVLLIALFYLLRPGSKISASQKTAFAICLTVPSVALLAPWLLWNHSIYGTWTAVSRLYGAGAAYAQHPTPVRNLSGFNFSSLFSYHFLPAEFWLNQLKTPLWLKLVLFASSALSIAGLILPRAKPAGGALPYQNLFRFCVFFYLFHLLVVLAIDVLFSVGPVRWAFGCFFAFAFLWCDGIDLLARRWFQERLKYAVLGITLFLCVGINLYLLIAQVPHLNGFGLHP